MTMPRESRQKIKKNNGVRTPPSPLFFPTKKVCTLWHQAFCWNCLVFFISRSFPMWHIYMAAGLSLGQILLTTVILAIQWPACAMHLQSFCSTSLVALPFTMIASCGYIRHSNDCSPPMYVLTVMFQLIFFTANVTMTVSLPNSCVNETLVSWRALCWTLFAVCQIAHVCVCFHIVQRFVRCAWKRSEQEEALDDF